MKNSRILVLSYVPVYNRQGIDLARLLRSTGANVTVYQLAGQTDVAANEHGVPWVKPDGRFSSLYVLWNLLGFVIPTFFRRKNWVICVGRPILLVGALYKCVFRCKLCYYALEYSYMGKIDRWALHQVDRYIDVEENRCMRFCSDYGIKVPTMVIHNMPPLHKPVKGGSLRKWLSEKYYAVPKGCKVVIYAGSYQRYACFQQMIDACPRLSPDTVMVLMTYNLPEQMKDNLPSNCYLVNPVSGEEFYEWLTDADCALLPYEDDTDFNVQNCSPQKLFDCYLAGVPYLASDRPLIRKVLSGYPDAGRICDFTDANCISRVINSSLRKDFQVSAKMHDLHKTMFNYEFILPGIVEFLSL